MQFTEGGGGGGALLTGGAVWPDDAAGVCRSDPSGDELLVLRATIVVDALIASRIDHHRWMVREAFDLVRKLRLQLIAVYMWLESYLTERKHRVWRQKQPVMRP